MSDSSIIWLTLGQAAERLGVHAATLRRWADQGDVPVMLTPGGHRRFNSDDIEALISSHQQGTQTAAPAQVWAEKAIERTRHDVVQQSDMPSWLESMDQSARDRHRQLGRQLMGLTLQYISAENGDNGLLADARALGHEYGRISRSIGMSLTGALEAAMYFRDRLVEVALQLPESTRIRPEANLRLMRRINRLLNTVHLAIAEIYDD